jgi:hypothetical protein
MQGSSCIDNNTIIALLGSPISVILSTQHSDAAAGRLLMELVVDNTVLLHDSSTPQRLMYVGANIKLKHCSELDSQTHIFAAKGRRVTQNTIFNICISELRIRPSAQTLREAPDV